jgi:hypothetical protein
MALVLQKVYTIPVIVAVRTNFQGDIYTLETPEYTDVVIVDEAGEARCTCQVQHCEHIAEVFRRRAINAEKNARRDLQLALFDLSFAGDVYSIILREPGKHWFPHVCERTFRCLRVSM